jgi:hypothetical protein
LDISHVRSHVSGHPNVEFLTDHGRNGTEGKEV